MISALGAEGPGFDPRLSPFAKTNPHSPPMDEYTLCSSSSEQGEIPAIPVKRARSTAARFPHARSHLRNMYLPGTCLFVGPNTIPRAWDYPVGVLSARIKKRLRQDLPYPFLCCLQVPDRALFEGAFAVESRAAPAGIPLALAAVREKIEDVEGPIPHIKERRADGYKDVVQNFLAGGLFGSLRPEERIGTKILIRDSLLNVLGRRDVCTHFFVREKDGETHVVFDASQSMARGYYSLLSKYAEEAVKALGSEEARIYTGPGIVVAVCSHTVFRDSTGLQRMFPGIDVDKTVEPVVNRQSVAMARCPSSLQGEAGILMGIDYKEGEYILNDGCVYQKSPEGTRFSFAELSFADFADPEAPKSTD